MCADDHIHCQSRPGIVVTELPEARGGHRNGLPACRVGTGRVRTSERPYSKPGRLRNRIPRGGAVEWGCPAGRRGQRCRMSRADRIFCFEALSVRDPLVRAAERLYEQTQHPDERIPWGWIARSVKGRSCWRPGSWGKHLLVATPADRPTDPDALAGFAYGVHLPGYGGYVCYVGVDEKFRKRGVG